VRDCSGCSLCCKVLSVDALDKPACVWCKKIERSATGRSCGIYPERPQACRSFSCMWLLDEKMQPELRPDRSHVVFAMDAYVDAEFEPEKLWLYVHVDPDWPDAWKSRLPRLAITTFLRRGGSVRVQIGGQWIVFRDGIVAAGDDGKPHGRAIGMYRQTDPFDGLPFPTFDIAELTKRLA